MSRSDWTRAEVAAAAAHQPHLIIDNEVYAVQAWLEEHPGGAEVLLTQAGRDATQCFVRQGHSAEARALMARFAVGRVANDECWPELGARLPPAGPQDPSSTDAPPTPPPPPGPTQQLQSLLSAAGPPLLMAVLAIVLYSYLF